MLDSFISSVFGSRGRSGDGVAAQFGGANEMGKPGPVLGLAIESSKSAAGTGSLASSADLSSETRSSALKRHVLVVVTPRCIERFNMKAEQLSKLPHNPISSFQSGWIAGIGRVHVCGCQDGTVQVRKEGTLQLVMELSSSDFEETGDHQGQSASSSGANGMRREALAAAEAALGALTLVEGFDGMTTAIVAGNQRGEVFIWEVPSSSLIKHMAAPGPSADARQETGTGTGPLPPFAGSACCVPSAAQVWVGYGDGSLCVLDALQFEVIQKMRSPEALPVSSLLFSSIHGVVLGMVGSRFVCVWDASTLSCVASWPSELVSCHRPLACLGLIETGVHMPPRGGGVGAGTGDSRGVQGGGGSGAGGGGMGLGMGGLGSLGKTQTMHGGVVGVVGAATSVAIGCTDGTVCLRKIVSVSKGPTKKLQCVLCKYLESGGEASPSPAAGGGGPGEGGSVLLPDFPVTALVADVALDALFVGDASAAVTSVPSLKSLLHTSREAGGPQADTASVHVEAPHQPPPRSGAGSSPPAPAPVGSREKEPSPSSLTSIVAGAGGGERTPVVNTTNAVASIAAAALKGEGASSPDRFLGGQMEAEGVGTLREATPGRHHLVSSSSEISSQHEEEEDEDDDLPLPLDTPLAAADRGAGLGQAASSPAGPAGGPSSAFAFVARTQENGSGREAAEAAAGPSELSGRSRGEDDVGGSAAGEGGAGGVAPGGSQSSKEEQSVIEKRQVAFEARPSRRDLEENRQHSQPKERPHSEFETEEQEAAERGESGTGEGFEGQKENQNTSGHEVRSIADQRHGSSWGSVVPGFYLSHSGLGVVGRSVSHDDDGSQSEDEDDGI